jgi:hydrogenase small subunit
MAVMYFPTAHPWARGDSLGSYLTKRGISRREFLGFCGQMTAALGLASTVAPRIAEAIASQKRPTVLWLSLQECTGCAESVLRSAEPTIGDLVLDVISLDYQHNLMAAAGHQAESVLQDSMARNQGEYLLVVTGSIPLNEKGIYTTVGGRTAKVILEEAAAGAKAIIAIGACAHWGNVQAARPNPTGAVGVDALVKDKPVVNIAGCPPIADVVTATIVHYLTFGRMPALDGDRRPLFAYGARIHDQCPKRANFDAGQFVEAFDDAAARKGWCLYNVGCKGPATYSPCPIFLWNSRTSWPIGAGHPCIGCTERQFWDTMTPFYGRLPGVTGFGVERYADTIGAALAAGAVAGVATHAVASGVQEMRRRRKESVAQSGPGSSGRESNGGD